MRVTPSRIVSCTTTTRSSAASLSFSAAIARRALVGRVEHLAAPERVVDRDQAVLAQAGQHGLVVVVVVRLVGVDEDEVEVAVEPCDRLERGAEMDRDPVRVRALVDVSLRDLGVPRLDVAGVDVAALRQRRRHRERGVAGERSDLEHLLRTEPVNEQLEEASLDRAGEHLRRAHRRVGLLGKLREQRLGRRGVQPPRTARSPRRSSASARHGSHRRSPRARPRTAPSPCPCRRSPATRRRASPPHRRRARPPRSTPTRPASR